MQSTVPGRNRLITAGMKIAVLLSTVVGCGRGSSASINGRVTVDGVPVDGGSILLVPLAANGGVTGGQIIDGRYAVSKGLAPGKFRVELRQPRLSGRMVPKPFGMPGETVAGLEESIAADANEESVLEVTVMSGGNTADFEVHSRRR
jgi:hypothetical protein